MDSILIPWNDGNGNIVINKTSVGEILISSDTMCKIRRNQYLTFRTTVGDKTTKLSITQKAVKAYVDIDNLVFTDEIDVNINNTVLDINDDSVSVNNGMLIIS